MGLNELLRAAQNVRFEDRLVLLAMALIADDDGTLCGEEWVDQVRRVAELSDTEEVWFTAHRLADAGLVRSINGGFQFSNQQGGFGGFGSLVVKSVNSTSTGFSEFVSVYPARNGSQRRSAAQQSWNARIKEGYAPEQMIDGAERYKAWLEAQGRVGTSYVMQAATFLGPNKEFLSDWSTPGQVAKPRSDKDSDSMDIESLIANGMVNVII